MNPAPRLVLHGIGIDVVLYDDRLVLQKHGVIANLFEAEPDREIALYSVSSARITAGYTIWNSYLQCDVKREVGLSVMFHRKNEVVA